MSVPASDEAEKKKLPPVKENKRKKPWDHPKRPLSAYNYFFQEERKAIVNAVNEATKTKKEPEDNAENKANVKVEAPASTKLEGPTEYTINLDDETITSLLTEDGKISFDQIGKLIGQNWKACDPVRLAKYSELAKQDRVRYQHEMDAYNLRQNARELRQQEQEKRSIGSKSSSGESFRPAKVTRTGEVTRNVRFQVAPPLSGSSAFSNVIMPPTQSHESYGSNQYAMLQPDVYYPQYYAQYGMGFIPQGSRAASMSSGLSEMHGRESIASTHAYRAGNMGGGGYDYSQYSEYVPPPPQQHQGTLTQRQGLQGNRQGQALQSNYPSQALRAHRHPGEALIQENDPDQVSFTNRFTGEYKYTYPPSSRGPNA